MSEREWRWFKAAGWVVLVLHGLSQALQATATFIGLAGY